MTYLAAVCASRSAWYAHAKPDRAGQREQTGTHRNRLAHSERWLIESLSGLLAPSEKCAIRLAVCHFGAHPPRTFNQYFAVEAIVFWADDLSAAKSSLVNGLVSRLLWICRLFLLGLGPREMCVQQAKVVFWFREQCHGHNTSYNDGSRDI